ncbi:uncharacterized protein Hap1MRO34_009317 [Clarias gariepinus]|uniref:protein diaphanous homolog 1-like n=1 Tax=Clarias gariepinus TaxID=13013 RepID=UPI00234D7663|nr:protein diaphanous homolog 1-like [Clarias gariepinus]
MPPKHKRQRKNRDRKLDRISGIAEVASPDVFLGGAITISSELAEWIQDSEEQGQRELLQSWEGCKLAEPADWLGDSEEQRETDARQSWEGCRLAIRRTPFRGEAAEGNKFPRSDEEVRAREVGYIGGGREQEPEEERGKKEDGTRELLKFWAEVNGERIRGLQEQVEQLQHLLIRLHESQATGSEPPPSRPLPKTEDDVLPPPPPLFLVEDAFPPPPPPLLGVEDDAALLNSDDDAFPPPPQRESGETRSSLESIVPPPPPGFEDVAPAPQQPCVAHVAPAPQPGGEDGMLLPPPPGFEDAAPAPPPPPSSAHAAPAPPSPRKLGGNCGRKLEKCRKPTKHRENNAHTDPRNCGGQWYRLYLFPFL